MKGPDPRDLAAVHQGARLQVVMPLVEGEVTRMIESVEARVYRDIERGELTPEAALEAWRTIHSYRKLVRRMQARIAIGQSAGEEIADHMEIQSEDE